MSKSKDRKGSKSAPVPVITAVILALSVGGAVGQTAGQAQDTSRRIPENPTYTYVVSQAAYWSAGAEGAQVPQDIRIMQRIVSTALGEVAAPELPDVLKPEAESSGSGGAYVYSAGGSEVVALIGSGNRLYSIGGRDVSGFYMQGYGYLFTVKWRVGPGGNAFQYSEQSARAASLGELAIEARRAAAASQADEARAAGEAERALEQEREKLEERQVVWDQWSREYREMLTLALRDVVALYGSTLSRATPDESITFIADFGGGDAETVSLSARRGELTGASRDENLAAVQMDKGETGVSGTLRTELKIMAEIIDSSLQGSGTGNSWSAYTDQARVFGGDSSFQYVPGYGVLFHKAARLNIATEVIRQTNPDRVESGVTVQSLRRQVDEFTEQQRQAYSEHLSRLKEETAAIMVTYGPTLTEMSDDEWVGVYYNVGSAAGLLEGGITNFLVQARMGDVRQASRESDAAAWLLDRLVTNEKQD